MNEVSISILCPSRGRPKQLERFIDSAILSAESPCDIEFLFYIDEDDKTFENFDKTYFSKANIKILRGKRLWISLAQNFLYSQSSGNILMAAADDFVFKTKGWDTLVLDTFESLDDKLYLVYGSDGGTYQKTLAIYGFFHRDWVDTIGYWAHPGRGSLYDLWAFEVAKKIDRLIYLPDLVIEHVHYRQGEKKAIFDETYSDVSKSTDTWRPKITYRKIERERRIDLILLSEKAQTQIPFDINYVAASLILKFYGDKCNLIRRRRLLTMRNLEILISGMRKIIKN
jgi:hypothetical protein